MSIASASSTPIRSRLNHGFQSRSGHHEQDRRQGAGGGRRRQADEVALVDVARLHVEAGETGRGADQEEERRQPAGAPELFEPPQIGEQGRRHAEGDQVGERVVLPPEVALGAGHARDAAVEAVEDRRHEDEQRRQREAVAQAEHHGVEAEQHVGDGEDAGQQVGAPARPLAAAASAEHAPAPLLAARLGASRAAGREPELLTHGGVRLRAVARAPPAWCRRAGAPPARPGARSSAAPSDRRASRT